MINKNKKIYIISLLILLTLFITTIANTQQNEFRLELIETGSNYIYTNQQNGEVYNFTITKKEITGNLFSNRISVNSSYVPSTLLGTLPNNTIFEKDRFEISFSESINTNILNSARGNIPIITIETRNITFQPPSGIYGWYCINTDVVTKFENANRGDAILRGEPVQDIMSISIVCENNNVTGTELIGFNLEEGHGGFENSDKLDIYFEYPVTYIPSDYFNYTFKNQSYNAVNISQEFGGMKLRFLIVTERFGIGNLYNNFEDGWQKPDLINLSSIKYVFIQNTGLPVEISDEKFQLNPNLKFNVKLSNNHRPNSFILEEYSWEKKVSQEPRPEDTNVSGFPLFMTFLALFILRRQHRK